MHVEPTEPGRVYPVHQLTGAPIRATDGPIGRVRTFLFDDEQWTIRYCVVDTGGWLTGRDVLISAAHLARFDWAWAAGELTVELTRAQVESAPGVEADEPVSRQREAELAAYYGLAPYWSGPYLWSPAPYPGAVLPPPVVGAPGAAAPPAERSGDSHLRSVAEVTGYAVVATDGDVGHVEDFLVADVSWRVEYVQIDTGTWWSGRKIIIPPGWIARVEWDDRTVYAAVDRARIQTAPAYEGPASVGGSLGSGHD